MEKSQTKNALLLCGVTGGAGCIGTNLCRKLAESGARKVMILDDLSSANRVPQSSI
ncbi:MAG: NAD-dependent epimerase/dehydratase family protein [Candidatus Methanospirareceae archaeon]